MEKIERFIIALHSVTQWLEPSFMNEDGKQEEHTIFKAFFVELYSFAVAVSLLLAKIFFWFIALFLFILLISSLTFAALEIDFSTTTVSVIAWVSFALAALGYIGKRIKT